VNVENIQKNADTGSADAIHRDWGDVRNLAVAWGNDGPWRGWNNSFWVPEEPEEKGRQYESGNRIGVPEKPPEQQPEGNECNTVEVAITNHEEIREL
jgi:hypothetical protein